MEVDKTGPADTGKAEFFNSRPLVEVNQLHCEHYTDGIFSTHDLSWRSTKIFVLSFGNNFFQLTTSRGDRHVSTNPILLVAIFQLTTSRGDRRDVLAGTPVTGVFQLTTSRGDRLLLTLHKMPT